MSVPRTVTCILSSVWEEPVINRFADSQGEQLCGHREDTTVSNIVAELGDVITVSSLSARYPKEGGSSYTASKFGVNGFMRSLRKELSDETVRVTVVMPGPVVTELNDWEHWDGRAMDPQDVAETVVFAVSRPSRDWSN